VHTFRKTALAGLLLVIFAMGGPVGLCSLLNFVGVSHHHDVLADGVRICQGAPTDCGERHVPCGKVADDFPDFQFEFPSGTRFSNFSPPSALIESGSSAKVEGAAEATFPGPLYIVHNGPTARQIVLCRLLI